MHITLTTPITIIKQPEIAEIVSEIEIERIIDIPKQKKVIVFIGGKRIELPSLSNDNYDNPSEWTNADIITAVKAYYGINI